PGRREAARSNRVGARELVGRERRLRNDDPHEAVKAKRGHLAWSNVDTRLRSMREIWIATASPKGRPDAVPVWFWWDGEDVYFTCKAGTTKPRNIAQEPRVVLHNVDGIVPFIIKGRAECVSDPVELDRVDTGYRAK